jgi:tetratricopeptide (TPR) repeat protein
MPMIRRRLVGVSLACAAGVIVGCGDGPLGPGPGKMPISTSSKAALKEYLTGRDLNEKLRGGEAHAHFLRAVELDPKFALAYVGIINTATGPTETLQALQKAMELAPTVTEAEANVIRSIEAGINSQPAEQRRLLEANANAYPDDERAHTQLGQLFFARQEWEAAIKEYTRAIAIDPNFSPPYNQLGYALRYLHRDAEAEAAFKTYTELLPDEPNPYDSHAEMLLYLGRYREAIVEYQKALDLNPNFPSAYVGIGHAYLYLGEVEEARKAFIKLRFIARNDGETRAAYLWLAGSYLFVGDHDGAVAEIEKRMELARSKKDTISEAGDEGLIGQIYLDGGRTDKAEAAFREALRLFDEAPVPDAVRDTTHVNILFFKSRLALARGDIADAEAQVAEYRKRVEARRVPEELRNLHLLRGLIAGARGDHKTAVAELSKANQNDPRVLLELARAEAAAGERDKALETCRRALVFNRPDLGNAYVRVPGTALLKELTSGAAAQRPTTS